MTTNSNNNHNNHNNNSRPWILVTGGCGYIGSHTILCLLQKDYNIVVVDNLSNASSQSLDRVAHDILGMTKEQRNERLVFYKVDLCHEDDLRNVFETSPRFQACIHFAGLKVGRLVGWLGMGRTRFMQCNAMQSHRIASNYTAWKPCSTRSF